jgi:hypothetical protein
MYLLAMVPVSVLMLALSVAMLARVVVLELALVCRDPPRAYTVANARERVRRRSEAYIGESKLLYVFQRHQFNI